MNKSKVTARFYAFEKTLETLPAFGLLTKRRKMADLQLAAGYVWGREGGRGKCPFVRPRDGKTSYWIPDSRIIELAPSHRNLCSLLHEIAHALGPNDKLQHGPAFQKRVIRLYRDYGDWNGEVSW